MRFRWLGKFMAGGLAVVMAPPPAGVDAVAELSEMPEGTDGWMDAIGRRGGNIAIVAGLALIPLVAAAGFASDQDLHIGARVVETLDGLLRLAGSTPARG